MPGVGKIRGSRPMVVVGDRCGEWGREVLGAA